MLQWCLFAQAQGPQLTQGDESPPVLVAWVTSPGTERCSLGFSPTLESIWSKLHFWIFLDCILKFLDNLRTQPVPVGWSHHPWESNWRQSRHRILGSSSGQLQCMGSPAWLSLLSLLSMGAENSTRHNSRVLSLG